MRLAQPGGSIIHSRVSKAKTHWTVVVFSITVLFCLAQNSGVFNALQQIGLLASTQQTTSPYDSAAQLEPTLDAEPSANSSEFKKCELSEKSLRVCLDEVPAVPWLVLLFVLPLIVQASRQSLLLFTLPIFPQRRRIHLSLCRFQE